MDEILGAWPVLKRLENMLINLDKLGYLAERPGSFDAGEAAQVKAMAEEVDLYTAQAGSFCFLACPRYCSAACLSITSRTNSRLSSSFSYWARLLQTINEKKGFR